MDSSTCVHQPVVLSFTQDDAGGVLRVETEKGCLLYLFSHGSHPDGLARAFISLGRQLEQGNSALASTVSS